jgi:hypothetical protein
LGITAAMERLLGSASGGINGKPLWEFMTSESSGELRSRVATGCRRPELRFSMTFIGSDSREHVFLCNLDVQPNAFALLCEATQ